MTESWPAGKVEYRPTADLKPYENNARTHSIEQVCYAIEINPVYVDVCVKRWQDYTGKVAVRESDMVPALAESAA